MAIRVSCLRELASKMDCTYFRYLFSCMGVMVAVRQRPLFLKRRVRVRVHRLHGHSRPRPWFCWSLLRQHFDPAVVFSLYCRPLAPVHDPGLVGCFFAITSILPSFSRFMVESSSGYCDRSIAKILGRSTASLFSLLFPRPVMMVSVVEIDVSKYCRFLG